MFKLPLALAVLAPLIAGCTATDMTIVPARAGVLQTASTSAERRPSDAAHPAMPRPKLIIFDVNETLLDLAALRSSVREALGGHEELLPLWFSTMLHYSLVETLTGEHHSFGEIGTAALMMVASTRGLELTEREARLAIIAPLRSLPPHDDVVEALRQLSADGYRIVSLTNSSAKGVETQFKNAGLTDLFFKRYTVDTVGKFKPHPAPYQMVLDDLGVEAAETMMVAAHAWDLAGAKSVGLQTVFVKRLGKALYPLASKAVQCQTPFRRSGGKGSGTVPPAELRR